jgi:monoamine oxidase
MKTIRSHFFATMRKAFNLALRAEKLQTHSTEIIDQNIVLSESRRKFLENAGKTLIGGAIAPNFLLKKPTLLPNLFNGINPPRIVIIGAGIAGLNALHHLKKNNLDATIFEASGRTSGRILSVKNAMGEGTLAEFGAEFIDTLHADMWALAKEFDIELLDYGQASEANLATEAFFFEGQHRSLNEVVDAFRSFAPRMAADMEKLPEFKDINYRSKDHFVRKLDRMSLSSYLTKIGASGWIKKFIEVAYESEYGLSPKLQSSLNLTLLISPETTDGHISLFGESDERYKVKGGNQRIPDALAQKYSSHIQLSRPLESLRMSGNAYKLHFGGMSEDVIADYVILALPFTKLRQLDFTIDMPEVKRKSIETLSFGTNSKLMLGMQSHFWRKQGYTGLVYSDNGIPNGWDNAQLQTADNDSAGLSILFGGQAGLKVGEGSLDSQKDIFLPKWNQIYPGAKDQFNGKVARMHWPSHPFTLCSYVCPTVGQYTSVVGAEQMPVGNLLFAGEHCGGDFSGFMNGAAKSGREAAEEIVRRQI